VAVSAGHALVGGSTPSNEAALSARIETMPARPRGMGVVHPMRWLARTPVAEDSVILDADVELGPAAERTARITVTGSYRPPLESSQHAIDPAVRAKIACAVMEMFLARLAQHVERP
jgi:hypothetical protein